MAEVSLVACYTGATPRGHKVRDGKEESAICMGGGG